MSLKEGDEIQFSSRGPKIIFSTRDPSPAKAFDEPPLPESAPTEVFSQEAIAAEAPRSEARSAIWERLRPYIPVFSAGAGLLVLLSVGFFVLKLPWATLLIGTAVLLLIAGGGYLGWKLWRRRKSAAAQKESADEERAISLGRGNQDNLQDLKKKWNDVLRSLRDSKLQRSGEDPIYALPWFLVIGEPGSGKSALIKTAGPLSSVVTPGESGPTRNCDWWFFDKLVVLDVSGRYVFQAKESEAQGEWQTLLAQLKAHRRNEPLNGVVVTLTADACASRPLEKLKEQAAQLRERLDEMSQILGLKFPVYLVVSKCDLIPGFSQFFDILPEQTRGQALGYVNTEDVQNADAPRFFTRAFRTIVERLERLWLSIANEAEQSDVAREAFLLPAELRSFQAPLRAWIEILFRPSPYRDAPFCRGIFFTSARGSGSPISRLSHVLGASYRQVSPVRANYDLFARDLFLTALPNDRALVGHTAISREGRRITRMAGLITTTAVALLICGVLTLSFKNNWSGLQNLNLPLCSGIEKGATGIVQNLRSTDACRQVIDGYVPETFREKLAMNFGLAQWPQVGAALRERFSHAFSATVLQPLDAAIDQKLTAGSGSSLLLGSIFQRIRLLSACQEQGRCLFTDNQPDINYAVMMSAIDSQAREGQSSSNLLQQNYRAFLLWQAEPGAYERMKGKDRERVDKWVDAGGLSNEKILSSANELFPPIRNSDFWDVPLTYQVDGAYTAKAWTKGIEPLIAALKQINSERTETKPYESDLKEFETRYKRETLQKWGDFLARFPASQPRNAATPQALALILMGAKSPFQAVLRSADENITGIFGDSIRSQELPSWTVLLLGYADLKQKLDLAQKAGKSSNNDKDSEALGYLAAYMDASKQLPGKFSTPQESFIAAQNAFREGEQSAKPTQPILQAFWAIKMLKSTERLRYPDPTFWVYLERPIDSAWRAILDGAAENLQQQWMQIYLAVSDKDMAPGLRAAKIQEFVNAQVLGFLKPQRSGYQANTIAGQGISLAPQFIALISTLGPDSLSDTSKIPKDILKN